MSRFWKQRRRTISLVLGLLLLAGCSRPAATNAPSDEHAVPFHDGGTDVADPQTGISPAADRSLTSGSQLPFRDAENLPAGTLLTVRLKSPISPEDQGSTGIFTAVVDEPVQVDGNSIIPRGVMVSGRVESAGASQIKRNRGYVRLTLESIKIDGRDYSLQTASLFARGDPNGSALPEGENAANAVHLEKDRRLTFRLTESVDLASARPPSVQ